MSASRILLTTLAMTFATGSAFAGPVAADAKDKVIIPEKRHPMGSITLGYQGSEDLHTGFIDSVTPIFAPGDSMLFLSSRSSLDDSSQYVSSLGLGFRHLIPESEVIIGANAFWDRI